MTRAYLLDVSAAQQRIDWPAVAAYRFGPNKDRRISGVYIKSTSGVGFDLDPFFKTNVAGARKAGLLVGLYHWWVWPKDVMHGPERQAMDFERAHVAAGGCDLPPAIDFEYPTPEDWDAKGVLPQTLAPNVLTMAEAVERTVQKKPIIYSYPYFVAKLPRGGGAWMDLCELAERFPLWVAGGPHYMRDGKLPREDDDTPDIPGDAELPPIVLPWKPENVALWQFGGGGIVNGKYLGNFRCAGIDGYVDCNVDLCGMVPSDDAPTLRSIQAAEPNEVSVHGVLPDEARERLRDDD